MSGIVDTSRSGCDERMADAEAWRPNDPALGGFTEKVWSLCRPIAYTTEIVTGILRRRHWGEEATAARRSWNPLPNHI